MKTRTRYAAWIALLACSGCGGGDDACAATDVTCNPPAPSYEILLREAPPGLGALLIRVEAGGRIIELRMKSPNGLLAQAAGNAQGTVWRGVLLGRPSGFDLGVVTAQSSLAVPPVVTVEEAATDAGSGYVLIPVSSVNLEIRLISR